MVPVSEITSSNVFVDLGREKRVATVGIAAGPLIELPLTDRGRYRAHAPCSIPIIEREESCPGASPLHLSPR
jgi:hypothetical protein